MEIGVGGRMMSELIDEVSFVMNPKCTFNYTQINSTTIKYFPSCPAVYGILVINLATDLLIGQLRTAFINMKKLFGGIRIENTKWNTLNMFSTSNFKFYCDYYGFYAINNSQLSDATFLKEMNSQTSEALNVITRGPREAVIQDNNPKLFQDGVPCKISQTYGPSGSRDYRTRLNITGEDCGDRVEVKLPSGSNIPSIYLLFILTSVFYITDL
uniref:Recep_L_domain domain-containing protein n=1 Tax=Caenorhabditis tropicalis TaxID=1561998 RepID=A0A1I7TY38_9PELO